jgi:hypothetical protein
MAEYNPNTDVYTEVVDAEIAETFTFIKDVKTQAKATHENGVVTPDAGYDGLHRVEVDVPLPSGSIEINSNGTHDVTMKETAIVSVPNSYGASDEGKVVSNGALVAQGRQTITQNGTYDTTLNDEVVVNVSGGGGGNSYPWLDATYDGTLTDYNPQVTHQETIGQAFVPASAYIEQAVSDGFSNNIYDLTTGNKSLTIATKTITQEQALLPVADFVDLWACDVMAMEYGGYIYGTQMITDLGLVLLGDFSQGGMATRNALSDSIENYSGVILQGVYKRGKTSNYSASVLYQDIELDQQYWAGMQDRNVSYRCLVTFTDNTTVSLTGNQQVIIYGIL